ncbi:MAG: response regulator, partial [Treponema sp.]|nr:response regulator [Treponema sp.]
MTQQEYLCPQRAAAYTPEILAIDGQGCFWEYYSNTNRIVIYGHAYIKELYGFDTSCLDYDLNEYIALFCDRYSQGVVMNDIKTAVTNHVGYDNIHRILNVSHGTYRVIHAVGIPRVTEQSVILCGITQDITASVGLERTDAVFAEAEKRVQVILDASPTACTFCDEHSNVLDCNKRAIELFHCQSKQEFLRGFHSFSPKYQPDGSNSREKKQFFLSKAMKSGREVIEWWYQLPSGEPMPTEVTLVRVPWAGSYCVAGHIRDLRQLFATQEDLIAARNRAEQSARAKSEFLANMSHEIRTPMNGIIGMTHIMLHGDISEKQRFYVDTIDKSAKHLLRLINDILDFSKIDAGKLRLEQIEFSFQKFLGDLLDSVMHTIEAKKLEITLIKNPDIPDTLIGDSLRLTQILLNLFSNAVKFTRKGGIRLTIDMDKPLDEADTTIILRFSLTDTGIGMNEEQIKGLFVPFSQADSSITRKYGGTGLGLAICKNLVTLMGGDIRCKSTPGQGAVFTFTVRLDKAPVQQPSIYHQVAGKRVFALIDEKTALTTMLLHHQILDCKVLLSADKDNWEKDLPTEIDLILISWADIRFRVKETLKKLSQHYAGSPPGILVVVSDIEDQAFITTLDSTCHILYRPVLLNVLYSHIKEYFKKPQEAASPVQLQTPVIPEIPENIRGAYILLVEDNEINQLMASELLTMGGFKVDIASNGREAVEMVAQNNYDIVLMDIQMPEMDGLTATRIIRQSANNIPILALTAH